MSQTNQFGTHEDDQMMEKLLCDLGLKKDSLDEPNFDVISYINEIFPNEQSLCKIEDVINNIQKELKDLHSENRSIIRGQLAAEDEGQQFIDTASIEIDNLFVKIREVQDRASKSEKTVKEITRDIQQLDIAKRNITQSITVLNNLLSGVEALDALNDLLGIGENDEDSDYRNPFAQGNILPYIDIEEHLGRAQRLLEPIIKAHPDVQSVQGLQSELDEIHRILNERITRELKGLLSVSNARQLSNDAGTIQAGCRLIDSLPNKNLRGELTQWFVDRELSEYFELFQPNQTIAWLDKVDQRFSWLRTNLNAIEMKARTLFPRDWLMLERVIVQFCRRTRSDFEKIIQIRRPEITHSLYIFALQRTLAFENSLCTVCSRSVVIQVLETQPLPVPQKSTNPFDNLPTTAKRKSTNPFGSDTEPDSETETKVLNELEKPVIQSDDAEGNPFDGMVSGCFMKHFDIYLANAEKALSEPLFSKFIGDFTVNESSLSHQDFGQVLKNTSSGPASSAENSLHSATDLFLLYKQLLKHTCALNRSNGLMGLVTLFKKYILLYAEKVLVPHIPGAQINFSNYFKDDQVSQSSSNQLSGGQLGTQLISGLISRDENQNLSTEQRYRVCVVLVTAAFCVKSVAELEKKIKAEVKPVSLAEQINFSQEIDALAMCRSAAVNRLVSDLDSQCDSHISAMARVPWNRLTLVGDQSSYVTGIVSLLKQLIPPMRDLLFTVRANFTQICSKFVDSLIKRFIVGMFRCKPINTFGTEQLLLDTQSLKSILLQLPTLGSKQGPMRDEFSVSPDLSAQDQPSFAANEKRLSITQAPPKSFTNLVQEGFGRAERIIKAVMLPIGCSSAAEKGNHQLEEERTGFIIGLIDKKAAESFVISIQQMLPDLILDELQKILEMKGVKRTDQSLVLDIYRAKMPKSLLDKQLEESALNETAPKASTIGLDTQALNKFRHLEKLIKRK
ncbi:Vacuolar protein sorting-associated protein 53 [Cichlidogyrus casuarinus]|uniref:Vacuolar protein sorting-associated protein 53 homolog n=1 Tax=Cichlidogyrus casuarinus TaxID=1844966 RepID=A0ABD2Q723_9PLAT